MLPTLGRKFADVSPSMYAVYAVMNRQRASPPQRDLHLLHARPRESVPYYGAGISLGCSFIFVLK